MNKLWMIRQDGKEISVPSLIYGSFDDLNIEETLYVSEWLYENTIFVETRNYILKLLRSYISWKYKDNIEDLYDYLKGNDYNFITYSFLKRIEHEIFQFDYEDINRINKLVNYCLCQEFIKANLDNGNITIKTSSIKFDWIPVINEFLAKHIDNINFISILRDENLINGSYEYYVYDHHSKEVKNMNIGDYFELDLKHPSTFAKNNNILHLTQIVDIKDSDLFNTIDNLYRDELFWIYWKSNIVVSKNRDECYEKIITESNNKYDRTVNIINYNRMLNKDSIKDVLPMVDLILFEKDSTRKLTGIYFLTYLISYDYVPLNLMKKEYDVENLYDILKANWKNEEWSYWALIGIILIYIKDKNYNMSYLLLDSINKKEVFEAKYIILSALKYGEFLKDKNNRRYLAYRKIARYYKEHIGQINCYGLLKEYIKLIDY